MKIYLDEDYKCHASNDGTLRELEAPEFFKDKCKRFIEGFRYVPAGETWTRSDGEVFNVEMIAPVEDYAILDAAQREYERQLLAEYIEALKVVGVTV